MPIETSIFFFLNFNSTKKKKQSELDEFNRGGMIFYAVILCCMNVVAIVLMAIRIILTFKKDRIKITVAILIFLMCSFAATFSFLTSLDPWSYFHLIGRFDYLVLTTNLSEFFITMSLILVSYHLSNLILKTINFQSYYNKIALVVAIILIIVYIAMLILSLTINLTYSTYKLSGSKIEIFRASVYGFIASYLGLCTCFFVYKLRQMWHTSTDQKEHKKIQYKRLIIATTGLWLLVILSLIFRVITLIPKYFYDALAEVSITGGGAIIPPGLSLCYFFLFKPHETETTSSDLSSSRAHSFGIGNSKNSKNSKFSQFKDDI